jgi:soluble lytic murein transglycosylase
VRPSLLKKGLGLAVAASLTAGLFGSSALSQVTSDPHAGPPPPESYAAPGRVRLSESDQSLLRQALTAAKAGRRDQMQSLQSQITDASARKLVTWAFIDAGGEGLGFAELDRARTDLAEFPRPARRQAAAEKAIEFAGLPPQQLIAWSGAQPPTTA